MSALRALFVGLLVVACLTAGCTPDSGETATAPAPFRQGERIVFFGDSITEAGARPGGYVTLLADTLAARYPDLGIEVIGAGISGNKVPDLLARVDQDVLAKNPTVVVIYIGINDVWHWDTPGLTGTEKDAFQAGLLTLVEQLEAAGARVMLCTPSVIGEKPDGSNAQDAMLDDYAAVSRAVARQRNVPLCDLRADFIAYLKTHNPENLEQGILTTDGVHLNAAGNQFVAARILAALETS